MDRNPEQNKEFFEVLAGKKGASYANFAHSTEALEGEGYLGLATTALKKGHPVKLYYEPNNYTGIGLLMTADSNHSEPCYVSSIDAWSGMNGTECSITNRAAEPYPELRKIQDLPEKGFFSMDLNENRAERTTKARQALTRMWELIEQKGTLKPEAELNEVLMRVKLPGIKGIVIDEGPSRGPDCMTSHIAPLMDDETFKKRVRDAKKLNALLKENYPNEFPHDLPIWGYRKLAENQLVQLTAKELMTGERPDHGKLLWPEENYAAPSRQNRDYPSRQ